MMALRRRDVRLILPAYAEARSMPTNTDGSERRVRAYAPYAVIRAALRVTAMIL